MDAPEATGKRVRILPLALGALGVVYGDIGTSPLYTMHECFHSAHSIPDSRENVLGVLSLIFWSLTFVVCVQYLAFILRADNRGEGGVFSLLALVPIVTTTNGRVRSLIIGMALIGGSLLCGDGVITPAISVLSAVEGLTVATDAAAPFVIPLSCVILVSLFLIQRHGTGGVGKLFGPVMLVWFATLAVLGGRYVLGHPSIVSALLPIHAVRFFVANGDRGFVVLGSVVLCVTGVEALYADLGHFGKPAIRWAWFAIVYPALVLNYFGQGAFLLEEPHFDGNPFYGIVPRWGLYPMVLLATIATVIASQALISGVFSLTRQAVQLGFLPRLRTVHTSSEMEGQIFVPTANAMMMLACLGLVVGFRSSSGLAGAYGIAVTGAMTITSILWFLVATKRWGWPNGRTFAILGFFLLFNLGFLGACLLKFFHGGWISILIAGSVFLVMWTWRDGRAQLQSRVRGRRLSLDLFLPDVARQRIHRVPGTAVFMTADPEATPIALLHHLKHSMVLHEQVILLCIQTQAVPTVAHVERLAIDTLGSGFFRIVAQCGFMETPNVPAILKQAHQTLPIDPNRTSYFLSREALVATKKPGMAVWRKAFYAFLSRNARPPTAYFDLPPGRVVELGLQIEF